MWSGNRRTIAAQRSVRRLSILWLVTCIACTAQSGFAGVIVVPDFSFESPDLVDSNTSEAFTDFDIGSNWSVIAETANVGNWGVQDPPTDFYGTQGPLPAPFDGRQIGFFNLHAGGAQARLDSGVLGTLNIHDLFSLNIAVGARNAVGWSDILYSIGLVADTGGSGTELGTFATISMTPGATPTNIFDLNYNLDVANEAAAFAGSNYFIRLRATSASGFVQANFDNVRLNVTAVPEPGTTGILLLALIGWRSVHRKRKIIIEG